LAWKQSGKEAIFSVWNASLPGGTRESSAKMESTNGASIVPALPR
jgi:hypothetical protein